MRQIATLLSCCSCLLLSLAGCKGTKTSADSSGNEMAMQPVGPTFVADSALLFCQQQCDFGPRTMNSDAHELCGQWIAAKFRQYGLTVTEQRATLTGYDGTALRSTNIIASYRPELTDRILVCAHWDSRPWADNDPVPANHRKPVLAANDGASGVAVMLEIARLLPTIPSATDSVGQARRDTTEAPLRVGVDFICFDAEDWGTPQWEEEREYDSDTWALGAHYWAEHPHTDGYQARYGILLDMVGGQGARFCREIMSMHYAPGVVSKVWRAAEVIGYGSFFPNDKGGAITDDHLPVNRKAKIPCIDIIPYYADCEASSFGPTWHTVNDDLAHLDKNTLQAVGQTLIQVLFSEKRSGTASE